MDHPDASEEIARLTITTACKRKAQDEERPLRQIFDEVCRQSSSSAAHQVSFATIESSMYKKRRLAQPALPSGLEHVDAALQSSRHSEMQDGSPFYRGLADSQDSSSATVFASNDQLQLLKTSTHIYFDATFKVVPALYFQLLTLFVSVGDTAFPVLYALMTHKTTAAYRTVFQKVKELVPDFAPRSAMADFEEAPVAAFREVYGDVPVSGCWFHYGQAIVKRVQKIGLKEAYVHDQSVKEIVQYFFGLPLLPVSDISDALEDVRLAIPTDSPHTDRLNQLARYVKRQWLDRRSVGAERLCVRDSTARTNNVLESYHASLRRRIQVTHPNLFAFLTHLKNATTDNMADMLRVRNGIKIRRAKKKRNLQNDNRIRASITRYDAGTYTRLQFLRAISHSLGAHTEAFAVAVETSDDEDDLEDQQQQQQQQPEPSPDQSTPATGSDSNCEVCLTSPRDGVALVPCGHARFCIRCADTVASMGSGCPICRTFIDLVMRLY